MKEYPLGLTRTPNHRYVWNDGKRVYGPMPGATTIIKLQDSLGGSDGLIRWAAGLAVDYVIKSPAPGDPEVRQRALEETGRPAMIGTDVHEQVRRIIVGEPILPNPDTVFHLAHFAAFLGKERPRFLEAERMVANLTLGYAGQFDFIAEVRDRVALVDVKTGKDKPGHRLQLAGYMESEFMGSEGTTDTEPFPDVDAAYVLLLRDAGWELLDRTPTAADRAHFRFLAETYQRVAGWAKEETAA